MTALTCAQGMAHVWVGTASVILVTMVMTAGEKSRGLVCITILERKCNPLAGMPEATWEKNDGLVSTACACTDIPRNMRIRKILSKNFQLRALYLAGMISRR